RAFASLPGASLLLLDRPTVEATEGNGCYQGHPSSSSGTRSGNDVDRHRRAESRVVPVRRSADAVAEGVGPRSGIRNEAVAQEARAVTPLLPARVSEFCVPLDLDVLDEAGRKRRGGPGDRVRVG